MGNTASGDKGRYRYGYHVLWVKDQSPASQAGLQPFFDYIMAVNGIRLNTESTTLREQMEASQDKPIILDVYSTREQELRKVEMTPTREWGGGNEGLIGCSIRFCLFDTINDIVWHVTDVTAGSPAEAAGLCARSDYIIGTPLGVTRGESDLYELVEEYIGEPLPLHVYNTETNQVRELVIIPSEEWGGVGLLGCDVGYGYLHRLPRDLTRHQEEKTLRANVPNNSGDHGSASSEKQFKSNSSDNQPKENAVASVATGKTQPGDAQNGSQRITSPEHSQSGELADAVHSDVQENEIAESKAVLSSADHTISPQKSDSTPSPQDISDARHQTGLPLNFADSPPEVESSLQAQPQSHSETKENISETFTDSQNQEKTDIKTSDLSTNISATTQSAPVSDSAVVGENVTWDGEISEGETIHQPPLAIAARLKPGIHGRGRGARITHDGFATRGRIPLEDAQAQAQQQSAEYRAQMRLYESANNSNASQTQESQGGNDEQQDEDTEHSRRPQNADAELHEHVVEAMIRNMSLGSSFPL
ncbi:Golgi reassembly-stacking protein 2 [Haplosporangium sp. Z 27]|nr:Golgi reassembly-stacking protein 2 [Haplosporangium sp. Z 27]